jgi:leucyl-tRNA synthetase
MKYEINERKWIDFWEENNVFRAENGSEKPTQYVMDMFPYPSGNSMHVGHPRGYVATDIYSRMKRMSGFNVLHTMGWDAFGLPAEQTAILNKENPTITVERNIKKFKDQLLMMGLGYDWDREINTTDPNYYRQTQRIFLEFFKKGLAYNDMFDVNWCPNLGTVLANEDILDGKSERGNHSVVQKPMRQWMLRITAYAERLYSDLDQLPQWPDKVKNAQRNWIKDDDGNLKMRDWVFSRQRFWGEPFPIVWIEGVENYNRIKQGAIKDWLPETPISYASEDGEHYAVPVIPHYLNMMELPTVTAYEPTGNMEGPLAGIDSWVNTYLNMTTGEISQTTDGSNDWISARRETNTMPQWAGSSWYWLRYMDSKNSDEPFSKESSDYWGPVNIYAGADHAVAHLIYARFWHKVLFDAGMVSYDEPFERLEFLGYVLSSDGGKISKRKGNSRSPEDVVEEVGADAFRLYEMLLGPFEKAVPWQDGGLRGSRRFLERVWSWCRRTITQGSESSPQLISDLQKLIISSSVNIEKFKFNVAGADFMKFLNEYREAPVSIDDMLVFLKLLAPFCPFMTEEIWSIVGKNGSIHLSSWPIPDMDKVIESNSMTIPVQVNGKIRGQVSFDLPITEDKLKVIVLEQSFIVKHIGEKKIKKFIWIKDKIVNIVV